MPDYGRYKTITITKENKIGTLVLNRPDRLNAVGGGMHEELEDFFAGVNDDNEINALIVTGAGRAFCAGGDIKEMPSRYESVDQAPVPLDFGRGPRRLILNLLEVEVPIIVAINGPAVGLGATLALLGDIVYASDDAQIGDPHVAMAGVAGDGGAVIWPLLIGVNRAKEYLMTGDMISAKEAERLGLVNHVVKADELMSSAGAMAERLANGPTWAIRWTKTSVNKMIRDLVNLILDTSLAYEAITVHTKDHREAVQAFLEKRPPQFRGE